MDSVSIQNAKDTLTRLHEHYGPGLLAFDGDGTLWTGDVAEDVVEYMLHAQLMRPAATGPLLRAARALNNESLSDPHALLEFLLRQDAAGRLDHETTCELIGATLAGYTTMDFDALAQASLRAAKLERRLIGETWELLRFGRALGHRILVVSASPLAIVESACAVVKLEAERAGVVVHTKDGLYTGEVQRPIPYNDGKVRAIEQLAPGVVVHAAFGDNRFDVPMLRHAHAAFAIRPKPALQARAGDVPEIRLLEQIL
jgi:phosphatidylglycerophosphatase C